MTDSYVYALVDPRNDEIRYVGITTKQPHVRFNGHMAEARRDTKTEKRAWIRSLTKLGLEPIFSVIEQRSMSKLELAALEMAYIAQYTMEGHKLTNITEGGDGVYGYAAPRTEEWRRKLSEATQRHYAELSNQERSERSSRRLASILARNNGVYPGYTKGRPSHNKGGTLSEETKEKMREAHRLRWERYRADGRYEEICANIAAGTARANNTKENS